MASASPRERHHRAAREFHEALDSSDHVVISDYVFDETMTRLRMTAGHSVAIQTGKALRSSAIVRLERVTDADFELAWNRFMSYADQRLSFTDCTTMAMAERLEIRKIFAFDEDFTRLGYETIPSH